ncbi:hypothetical protein [Halorubrum kocurii]|uniref:Uncharacterized protein n=1 Tax=Halorubrum kocurii JCM 14978 TaxID=1230456 RepID=M0P4X1_9EURY|nr:hypothetical protein [Halorubrum kocurii]EMA64863.1 hypothetical protein C468_08164 [Halorubrum kocurii JCM 14978]
MGGFKSGAADDDWGDGAATDRTESEERETDATESTTDSADSNKSDTAIQNPSERARPSHGDLPWVLTRSSITDGREQTVQLHLQQSTVDAQREATRTLEAALGESVKKADLREAALLVGLRHPEEVAATLREWGYDLD